MRAGKLDRTITLQRLTRTVSPAGTVTETWADLATVRAELVSNTVTEAGTGYGEADNSALTFRIRYLADLTTEDRVLYQGAALDLAGILELGRRRALELRCEAVS
jgi:SPP1 family predicted phage head-tail adaptor